MSNSLDNNIGYFTPLRVINHYGALSTAIRAGCKLAPQGWGGLVSYNEVEHWWATCAIGAGFHALTGLMPTNAQSRYDFMDQTFPYLVNSDGLNCPECSDPMSTVRMTIWHLNDYHKWTREKVADWLEEWENANLGYETLIEKEVDQHAVQHA